MQIDRKKSVAYLAWSLSVDWARDTTSSSLFADSGVTVTRALRRLHTAATQLNQTSSQLLSVS